MATRDGEDDLESTVAGTRAEIEASLAPKSKSQRPWLIVVAGSRGIGKMYRLQHRVVLGRSAECDVQIDEEGVSRKHATLELAEGGVATLVDTGSRNGTFINGERVTRELLRDGDKIQIGTTTILKFSYQDELDEALQRNLYESATRDPLTRAVNKRGFEEALTREFTFARRHGRPLSLLAIDVDHFKRINDTHGHQAGDDVLRRLAEALNTAIRHEDVLARVGGEEFVVLLRDIGREGALECAERLRSSVERAVFEASALRIAVTVSIGVATLTGATFPNASDLLQAADGALYEAKRAGRNRVCAG